MNLTYDPEAEAAYVSLVERIEPGEAVRQSDFIELPGGAQAVLDFDADGKLLGIELLFVKDLLRAVTLARAVTSRRTT
ncbi:hypothetical protein GCM10022223_08210 [Kineosporia mesophila]|uniref:DUF2283 domain-containing protein n=1 Tax=Kineosporia mesophila TaxID=566012 RepID=A0ABP6Z5U8_9ACTN|nr:DUF2283 domain-containing protein [Kineosporia mesophila]MCD5351199.1 DUF2283 domain-containing protein [Kineosporia mesophila]